MLFIESRKFTEQVTSLNGEDALRELEQELLADPERGDLIQNTGGFRKIRMKLSGRGKSAGARVIYFPIKARSVIVLFYLYTKSRQADLTADQKAALRQQAQHMKTMP